MNISTVRVQVERDIRRAKTFGLVHRLSNAMGTQRMQIIIRGQQRGGSMMTQAAATFLAGFFGPVLKKTALLRFLEVERHEKAARAAAQAAHAAAPPAPGSAPAAADPVAAALDDEAVAACDALDTPEPQSKRANQQRTPYAPIDAPGKRSSRTPSQQAGTPTARPLRRGVLRST